MLPHNLELALEEALSALELIATPPRPDGTYNRSRQACELLAKQTLDKIQKLRAEQPTRWVVYSDGACKGNPGPSAWGCVALNAQTGELLKEDKGSLGRATNQIAELRAAQKGLEMTPVGAEVELVSDSQYVLKGISEWRKGWEKRGWTNSTGAPVANKELWVALFALVDERRVTVRWVRGHTGDRWNERCDQLANEALGYKA